MVYHILVVDDDQFQAKAISLAIEKVLKYKVTILNSGKEACKLLLSPKGSDIDLVILDLSMPEVGGLDVLDAVHPNRPDLPIIINTAYGDNKKAIEAIEKGAVDFINKKDGPERLKVSIDNIRKLFNMRNHLVKLKSQVENKFSLDDIIGHSEEIQRTKDLVAKAANRNIPILLFGESGVGKELMVKAAHSLSSRSQNKLISVNCTTIPDNLIESVLFGHEKGSFTGAVESTLGKFREADGGTIFLDEIGEMAIDAQAKLLRVLQNYEVEPVGSSKTYDINVRVICATNKNLEKEVAEGRFREDLFYRINALTIDVPPLRERQEDIPYLIEHFVNKISANENIFIRDIEDKLIEMLQDYWWPGNVRQLENSIYRAMVLCEDDTLKISDFEHVLEAFDKSNRDRNVNLMQHKKQQFDIQQRISIPKIDGRGNFKTLSSYEKEVIEGALDYYKWNISKVSKILDIGRSTLYRKMREYNIEEKNPNYLGDNVAKFPKKEI